jgi:sugar (pentulose or hexulose) kinase
LITKELLLAIDNGTQSIKALVFGIDGRLVAKESVALDPYYSKQPGWAEQDPEVFWRALCRVCQMLWKNKSVDKNRIAGMALTTQRGTVINVDRNGRPLRPAIVWLDQRKAYGLPPLGGVWGALFRLLRLSPTIDYLQAEAEANWITTYQPEVWKQTAKYLLLSGYLTHKLTGKYVDSVGCQVGYIPFDYKRLKWASGWDWKWRILPISRQQLPILVPPGQVMGEVSQQASQESGLPAGLPLVAAAADKACEVIGSGSLEPSTGCLSYGTTATINATHQRYVEAIPLLPPYPSAVPDYYTVEVQIYRGYWMVSWFKEEFGYPEQQEAALRGVNAEDLFEDLVMEIPPGSMGLMLQPFWTPGLKNPGPEAKGAIIGFGDVHSRAHLYRSILEGLAYALREGKERIEKRSKIPITSIRVSGGGSQSKSAMQLTADIFGLPTARPHLYETSGLGASIDAAVGLGLHPDFKSAVAAMTRIGEVFEPDRKNHALYDALYREVYKKMYRRLKPLYRRIRDITGYPK